MILSTGTNANHEPVKEGWCWWYQASASYDTELEKAARGMRKTYGSIRLQFLPALW